jgi:hypothetical protein
MGILLRYAGRGCSDQSESDQSLFSMLHSSKDIPPRLDGETGMCLKPIRMKAEHPSTTLPSSARIHFGRVYEVCHHIHLKSLGLIHDSSMENLLEQYRSSYAKEGARTQNNATDRSVLPADMDIVKDLRRDIRTVVPNARSTKSIRTPGEMSDDEVMAGDVIFNHHRLARLKYRP